MQHALMWSAGVLALGLLVAPTTVPPTVTPSVSPLPVPFVPQDEDTCGAAALAMVLRYHGKQVLQERIAGELLEPELQGIRGSRLAEWARREGMVAIAFAGDLALLREHLGRGRPLVLAISKGRDRFHDVVAVGYDADKRELIVNDPADGPGRRIAEGELERRWKAAGYWTLLVQPAPEAAQADATAARSAGAASTSDAISPATEADEGARGPSTTAEAVGEPAATAPDLLLLPADAGYEALVAGAVALGRAGSEDAAAAALDRAIRLDASRPDAWTERGGLHFLAGRYEQAAADLRRSLSLREDEYSRDLLGSALHLGGQELAALAAWNRNGKPTLGIVEIAGLRHTRDPVARREIAIHGGATLTPRALFVARRRLEETLAFDRITLRTRPHGDGVADLDVTLAERHGFASGLTPFLLTTGVNLAWQRFRLRYSNLAGTGVSLGGSLRWQEHRPEASLQLNWPRPFSLPGYARLSVFAGQQAYEMGSPLDLRRAGLDAGMRFITDEGLVLSAGLEVRQRDPSQAHPAAVAGRSVGLDAGVEGRLVATRRQRLEASLRLHAAGGLIGSELEYARADAELRYEGLLAKPENRSVERSVLALRLRCGWGSDGLPLDEMYAPGVSPESDLPLRAHPLTRDGIIGRNPIGRSLLMGNAEWRQRLLHRAAFDIGLAAFSDAARVARPASGRSATTLVDAGLGLRLLLLGGPTLRVDQAWGLRDGQRALFIGLNQAF